MAGNIPPQPFVLRPHSIILRDRKLLFYKSLALFKNMLLHVSVPRPFDRKLTFTCDQLLVCFSSNLRVKQIQKHNPIVIITKKFVKSTVFAPESERRRFNTLVAYMLYKPIGDCYSRLLCFLRFEKIGFNEPSTKRKRQTTTSPHSGMSHWITPRRVPVHRTFSYTTTQTRSEIQNAIMHVTHYEKKLSKWVWMTRFFPSCINRRKYNDAV